MYDTLRFHSSESCILFSLLHNEVEGLTGKVDATSSSKTAVTSCETTGCHDTLNFCCLGGFGILFLELYWKTPNLICSIFSKGFIHLSW